MTVVEVLKAARARVAEGWCQGSYEMADDYGKPIAWCAAGAISRHPGISFVKSGAAYNVLRDAIGGGVAVSSWNDRTGRTQAEVLAAYDKAIALAAVRE